MGIGNGPGEAPLLEIYRRASLLKINDEESRRVIRIGKLMMPYYSYRGQEIIPAATCVALNDDDYICTIYRGIHDMLAKGMPLRQLWAELAGRVDGTCKGKGGPMHLTYPSKGVMVTTGIVGSSMPIANGIAWGAQLSRNGRVAVATFGDGASNIGAFHEALNLASAWKLPVIFLCSNNLYGEHTPYEKTTSCKRIADRAIGYDMAGVRVDGNDPLAMYAAVREAVDRARAGDGPTLIEAMTFRFFGHVLGDDDSYMRPGEKAAAMDRDPVILLRKRLLDDGYAMEEELIAMEEDFRAQVHDAIEFALASPFPGEGELLTDVYAPEMSA